jgi:hypothetical protein
MRMEIQCKAYGSHLQIPCKKSCCNQPSTRTLRAHNVLPLSRTMQPSSNGKWRPDVNPDLVAAAALHSRDRAIARRWYAEQLAADFKANCANVVAEESWGARTPPSVSTPDDAWYFGHALAD